MTAQLGTPVLVLAGGLSHEREVSLRSGHRVTDALRDAGLQARLRDADSGLLVELESNPPAVIFPMLHGPDGEDGALQGILESVKIPFVGASAIGARLAFDKANAKALLSRAGVRTPRGVVLRADTIKMLGSAGTLNPIVADLGLPLVVKPTRGGSALGVTVVSDRSQLPDALIHAYAYCDSVLLEEYIEGTEVAVTIVDTNDEVRVLPPVEIVVDGGLYDYEARYTPGRAEFFAPARLTPEALVAVSETARGAHEILGLRDLSRSDIIVDPEGQAWFLEVNVAPGMTATSLVPQAAAAAGLSLAALCSELVQGAVSRTQ